MLCQRILTCFYRAFCLSFGSICGLTTDLGSTKHVRGRIACRTRCAFRALSLDGSSTFGAEMFSACWSNLSRYGYTAFRFSLIALRQPCSEWSVGSPYRFPEFACYPLSDRGDGTTPHRNGLCQSRHELGSKPTISVSFLEEPTTVQVLGRNQIKHIRVNLSAN